MAEKPPNWRQMSRSDQKEWHKDQTCKQFDAIVARANGNMNAMPSNENNLPVREKAVPTYETNKKLVSTSKPSSQIVVPIGSLTAMSVTKISLAPLPTRTKVPKRNKHVRN